LKAKSFSEIVKLNKSGADIDKFNPYHDSLGRFTTSGGGASFSGTLLHGSPNKGIKEFDINRAGSNTGSGEKLLFFTNDKQMADDFSYERLPGSTKFMNVRGKKGEVYRTKVRMKKPLDFRNLSDDDIKAIKELDADGILTDKDIKMMAGMKNHGSLKAGLDLRPETLSRLGYDGIIANTDNGKTEFAVVDSKQTKIIHKSFSEILKSSKQVSLVERWQKDPNSFKVLNEVEDLDKFNPYHDSLGRFATGGGAASFTWKPGASTAHDNAIAREKERNASSGGGSESKQTDGRGHVTPKSHKERLDIVKRELGCDDKQAKKYAKSIYSFTSENYEAIRAYQNGVKNDYTKKFSRDAKNAEDYIEKAPKWNGGTLYRGINLENGDANTVFKSGTELDMRGTSSWSSDKGVADNFTFGSGTKVVFQCDKVSKATSVTHLSDNPSEKEVLVSKDTKYVSKKVSKKGNVYYVYLDEVTSTAKSFSDILKFNDNHDHLGRFSSGSSTGAAVASETSSGSYGNVDEFQKDKKETWSATSEFSENKKGAEQHFQAYKDFYSKYQKGTASKDNYYFDTMAEFDPMKSRPRRQPDYVSRDRNGKVSSEYWYTEDGVVRGSDHWGEGVASCDWSLKGVTSGSRPLEIEHTGKKYGKAKWEDFVHKPTVAEINGEKVMSSFHNMSEKGIITHKGTDYEYNRWESKWEPTTSSTAKSFSESEVKELNNADTELCSPPFNITKADEDKRLVFGWALVSADKDGNKLIDRQGDMVEPDDLEDGAYEYVLNFRDAGEEHIGTLRKKARMVESCVFTPEKMKAIGIPEGTIPVGWWIGFYVDDDTTWERIKSGKYKMFSIEGKAVREPIEDSQPHPTGKIAKSFSEIIEKFNPYHDRLGR
jgi:hypothetical protein